MNSETQQQPIGLPGIDVIIVGGVAGGQLVRGVNPEAQFFKLRRPDYIKPLTDSGQLDPEVAHVEDTYELHLFEMWNDEDDAQLTGIAVVEGQTLSWAFLELVTAYVEKITAEHIAAGRIKKQ